MKKMKKIDGTGVLPSVLKLESWGFYLLCAFALASNLSIAVGNVFLGALVLVVLLRVYKKRKDWRSALPEGQLGIALFVLMGTVFLSVLCSDNPGRGLRVFIDYYGYRMLGLYAILLLVKDRKRILTIAVCVAASFTINNVAILYEGVFLHDFRADGFVPYMTAGGFLSMLVPSLLFLLMEGSLGQRYRLPLGFLMVLSVVALLLNGTRGAWIAVAVSCVVIGGMAVQRRRKFFLGILAAALVFVAVFSVSPILANRLASIGDMQLQSNTERILLWKSAFHMFEDHPVLGVGFSRFREEYQGGYILPEAKEPYLGHAHNNIMHMLAECGFLGVVALLFFWLCWFSYGVSSWRTTRSVAALIFLSVLLGIFMQGLTEYNMGNSAVMKLYWLLLGLCLQWMRLEKSLSQGTV